MSSLIDQLKELDKELPNLSTKQLKGYKEVSEYTYMQVFQTKKFWINLTEKYKESWETLGLLAKNKFKKNKCLMKINDYMYAEGRVKPVDKVMVEIGAEYFATMTVKDAKNFVEKRGIYGLQLVYFFERLYDRKRMVYNAVDDALREKLKSKMDKR